MEFSRTGVGGTKIGDIADRAGISRQLLYRYYKGKDEIYADVLNEVGKEILRPLVELDIRGKSPVEAMRLLLETHFQLYQRCPAAAFVTIDQMLQSGKQVRHNGEVRKLHRRLFALLQEILAAGIENGDFLPSYDAHFIHFAIVSLSAASVSSQQMFSKMLDYDVVFRDGALDLSRSSTELILNALRFGKQMDQKQAGGSRTDANSG